MGSLSEFLNDVFLDYHVWCNNVHVVTWSRDNVLTTPGFNIHRWKWTYLLWWWWWWWWWFKTSMWTTLPTQPNTEQMQHMMSHNKAAQLILLIIFTASTVRSPPWSLFCSLFSFKFAKLSPKAENQNQKLTCTLCSQLAARLTANYQLVSSENSMYYLTLEFNHSSKRT